MQLFVQNYVCARSSMGLRHQELAHSQVRDDRGLFASGHIPASYLKWLLGVIIIDPSVGHSYIAIAGPGRLIVPWWLVVGGLFSWPTHDEGELSHWVIQIIWNYCYIMLLIQLMFHVQIIELENTTGKLVKFTSRKLTKIYSRPMNITYVHRLTDGHTQQT
jgi:hypothetical protein